MISFPDLLSLRSDSLKTQALPSVENVDHFTGVYFSIVKEESQYLFLRDKLGHVE